jgi:hypothetical protein
MHRYITVSNGAYTASIHTIRRIVRGWLCKRTNANSQKCTAPSDPHIGVENLQKRVCRAGSKKNGPINEVKWVIGTNRMCIALHDVSLERHPLPIESCLKSESRQHVVQKRGVGE